MYQNTIPEACISIHTIHIPVTKNVYQYTYFKRSHTYELWQILNILVSSYRSLTDSSYHSYNITVIMADSYNITVIMADSSHMHTCKNTVNT